MPILWKKIPTSDRLKKNFLLACLVVTILCIVAIIVLANILSNRNREFKEFAVRFEKQLTEKRSIIQSLEALKDSIAKVYPIIIDDIKIANTNSDGSIETDYGGVLYVDKAMFLKPKIYFMGLASGIHTLQIRWYPPFESHFYSQMGDFNFSEGGVKLL